MRHVLQDRRTPGNVRLVLQRTSTPLSRLRAAAFTTSARPSYALSVYLTLVLRALQDSKSLAKQLESVERRRGQNYKQFEAEKVAKVKKKQESESSLTSCNIL